MSDYTHLNLKDDVDDQAPNFGLGGKIEARMARVPLELEQQGVTYQRIAPNFRVPFGHQHNAQEEVYVLVAGSARLKLDDEIVELKPWDAVRIAKETMRNFEGGPEGAEVIAFGAPSTGPGDAPMTQGWWQD